MVELCFSVGEKKKEKGLRARAQERTANFPTEKHMPVNVAEDVL